jgi:hypothetical protein
MRKEYFMSNIEELSQQIVGLDTAISRLNLEHLDVQMYSVSSSNVASIGFSKANNSIYVRFNNGSLYVYPGQNEQTFNNFLDSPSKGKFVWANLRGHGESRI